jgi:SpoVK/Ycf46/Vps4 family AAA+-type ATPase
VAEQLKRPLYRMSGADLGSSTKAIERNLQAAFDRIARWQAILLLDEADAFMSERADDSLDRNVLVSSEHFSNSPARHTPRFRRVQLTLTAKSVLLRLLEYQSGIVILTTNRQDHFDKAFRSRIHITIKFPSLGKEEREIIWRRQAPTNPITRPVGTPELPSAVPIAASLSDEEYVALSELDLDGRSIKNAFHVAGLYVNARSSTNGAVSMSDLKAVLQMALGDVSDRLRQQVEEFCN